jgi:hypothetical protein
MGEITRPKKVNLIAGLLAGDDTALSRAADALRKAFGPTDFESGPIDFNHTSYYSREMGPALKRRFLGFEKPVSPEGICAVKASTNRIEKRLSSGLNRTVNIDPGYLDLSRLVLFTTKDYSHRIYLGRGIFAEVTLIYRDNTFNALPWTYPDYRTAGYIDIFNRIRLIYKAKLQ